MSPVIILTIIKYIASSVVDAASFSPINYPQILCLFQLNVFQMDFCYRKLYAGQIDDYIASYSQRTGGHVL